RASCNLAISSGTSGIFSSPSKYSGAEDWACVLDIFGRFLLLLQRFVIGTMFMPHKIYTVGAYVIVITVNHLNCISLFNRCRVTATATRVHYSSAIMSSIQAFAGALRRG